MWLSDGIGLLPTIIRGAVEIPRTAVDTRRHSGNSTQFSPQTAHMYM